MILTSNVCITCDALDHLLHKLNEYFTLNNCQLIETNLLHKIWQILEERSG